MNRRALRQRLGTRSSRRKNTKLQSHNLIRVKGAMRSGRKKMPRPAALIKRMIREES